MKARHTIWALVFGMVFSGCLAPVDDEDPELSDSSLVEGASEGSAQTSAVAGAMRMGALLESDVLRTRVSLEVGFDAGPLLMHAQEGPGDASRAALEIYRSLLEDRGFADGAAALDQLLSADPSDPSGAIAAVGGGSACTSFGGFFLRGSISEPDPPLARLIVTHDASAGGSCRVDGTVHYDLRVTSNPAGGQTVWVEMVYPDGLTITPESGEPFFASAGGSLSMGLAFDSAGALSTLEAGADYCVRRGAMGTDLCFEAVQLSVTGAVTASMIDGTCATCGSRFGDAFVDGLAGDTVSLMMGTSLGVDVSGTMSLGRNSLTLGGTMPLALEVAYDSTDGHSAMIDGEASTIIGGEAAAYVFSSEPGAPVAGLFARVPIGELAVTLDGCAARTVDAETRSACFTDLTIAAAEGTEPMSIRVTADGALTYTTPSSDATYTFTAASAQLLDATVTLNGSVTRDTSSSSFTVLFEALEFEWSSPSFLVAGVIEVLEGTTRLVRADFCPGSTYTWDGATETTTLTGCVTLEAPRYGTLELGTPSSAMSVTLESRVSTVDGPLTYDDPMDRRILSVGFEAWRAENLDTEPLDTNYHRRITGLATIEMLGFSGSVESMSGIEARVSLGLASQEVTLDGDLAIAIDVGTRTVTGTLDFTGYTATFMDGTIEHVGVVDMDLSLSDTTLLPTSAMRVTFGEGTTPFSTVVAGTLTTMDGRVILGVGCASGTCSENIDVLLTGVAFESPPCGRQHPHTGMAEISGLSPGTSALIPALRVRCECDGRSGRELLLPRRVTMVFTAATPTEARIQIPSARGVCRLRPDATCNEPGAAWLREDSVCM